MKHPTPSDFIVNVEEGNVSVIFKPSDSYYSFGRLADPEDIARHGPLSRSPNVRHAKTGDCLRRVAAIGPVLTRKRNQQMKSTRDVTAAELPRHLRASQQTPGFP